MSDKITACTKVLDGETVVQYDVSYEVESGANKNNFCVVIKADELSDASDLDEVKTKANVKAKAIKDAWVADLPEYVAEDKPTVEGAVTL